MDWFIICPIRGLIHTIPDDEIGTVRVIQYCLELADEIKAEGFCLGDIQCIRGEKHMILPPSGDHQLIRRKV